MLRNRGLWVVLIGMVLACFQNCAPTGFSAQTSEVVAAASSSSSGSSSDLPSNPEPNPGPNPNPMPGPVPGPNPNPMPGPVPGPNPNPMPGPVPGPNPTPNPSPSPTAAPAVGFYGRFDQSDAAGPRYTWSASSMVARFSGNSVSVTLSEGSSDVFYAYVVDNQPPKRMQVSAGVKTYMLATGLAAGTHQILFMRDSEGNEGVSQFRGFSFGGGGQLLSPPTYSNKYRLEFIGDSNTAGYGNLGVDPCTFSTATESAYYSYAQQTALILGAAPSTNISYSGIGIYRNWGHAGPEAGFPAMPGYYPRTLTDLNGSAGAFAKDPALQPTVVVINLGSNDFWNGPPNLDDFVAAYKSLYQNIRSHYPNAFLISAIRSQSDSKAYVQQAYNQIRNDGESRIRYIELPLQDSSGSPGCNGHASKAAHLESAKALASFIQSLGL